MLSVVETSYIMQRLKEIALNQTQRLFLTGKYFFKDFLLSFASDCAFGFLFSAVPILMMIIAILVRIFNATPEAVSFLVNFLSQFKEFFDAQQFVDSILAVNKVTFVEIILGVTIFLMASKFFSSVTRSLSNIFHTKQVVRSLYRQIFRLAAEVVLVIFIALFFIIFCAVGAFFKSRFFLSLELTDFWNSGFPAFLRSKFLSTLPYILLFFFIAALYRFGSGSKPKFWLVFVAALFCVCSFVLVHLFFEFFFNGTNYNYVYGILGKLLILLLEVYIFFILFLFFAEYIFISQFFTEIMEVEREKLPRWMKEMPADSGEEEETESVFL